MAALSLLMSWRFSVRSERCRSTVWTPSAGGSTSSPTRVTTYQVQRGLASVHGEEPRRTAHTQKLGEAPPGVAVFLHGLGSRSSRLSRIVACLTRPFPRSQRGWCGGTFGGSRSAALFPVQSHVPHTLKGQNSEFGIRKDLLIEKMGL